MTTNGTQELTLSHEERHRQLAREIFAWLEGKVVYADLLIEEIAKAEYNRLISGEEIVKPFTSKGALQLRLVGEEGRKLELSVGLLPFADLEENLAFAVHALQLQEPNPGFGLAPIPNPGRERYGKPVPLDLRDVDLAQMLGKLASEIDRLAEEQRLAAPEALRERLEIGTELWCYSQIEEKFIADSEGVLKTQILPSTYLSMSVKVKDRESGKITEQRARIGEILPLDFLFDAEGEGLRGEHRERLGRYLRKAVELQGGRKLSTEELSSLTHLVLDSTAMVFVHEAQGHNFEADIIKEGGSGLVEKDGKPARDPLGTPVVDLYDGQVRRPDGSFELDGGFGTHYIDDEGVEVQPVRLVKDGRIVDMLHSRETAHHFGVVPNGRGFSELGDPRIPRMTNTYLYPAEGAPWHEDLEPLFEGITLGVYLEGSKGGAVSKDGMSTNIQYCRLIRDGKLTDEVLLPANLTVRTVTALEGVEAFAGPLKCDDPGFCGKGQTKTVTDGGPVTRIRRTDAITIGW
ncbi:MAG: TldD/PmbA family protein [Deltaproteobacteria bacterium]|nr:TldD/PmbA family protein [Deltaproteobacteria bacterium]